MDLGDLDGQNGWEASGTVVQTNVVKSGAQAAEITDGAGYVRRTFVDTQTNVWTDFHYQPVFFEDPPSAIDPEATAVLYFNADGHPVVYNGQEPEVIEEGHTQYVVTGWTGTGSDLSGGTGTNVSFTITEDTTLLWQWQTNYWVELIVEGE